MTPKAFTGRGRPERRQNKHPAKTGDQQVETEIRQLQLNITNGQKAGGIHQVIGAGDHGTVGVQIHQIQVGVVQAGNQAARPGIGGRIEHRTAQDDRVLDIAHRRQARTPSHRFTQYVDREIQPAHFQRAKQQGEQHQGRDGELDDVHTAHALAVHHKALITTVEVNDRPSGTLLP